MKSSYNLHFIDPIFHSYTICNILFVPGIEIECVFKPRNVFNMFTMMIELVHIKGVNGILTEYTSVYCSGYCILIVRSVYGFDEGNLLCDTVSSGA